MARQTSTPSRNANLRRRAGGRGRAPVDYRPWWQRKRFIWSLAGVLFLFLLINWLIISGWFQATGNRIAASFYGATTSLGLKVEEVYITGRNRTNADEINAALDVKRGQPILSINLADAHTALMEIPWIESARIERHLPNVIYVAIEERTPYARWQYQQQTSLIDKTGIVLTQQQANQYHTLPLVVGNGANKHAAEILEELQAVPAFASNLKAAIRVSDRRWDLRLNNGMTLRLPETGMSEALQRLNNLWKTTDIASRNVRVIDARLSDRVIIDENKPADKADQENGEPPL